MDVIKNIMDRLDINPHLAWEYDPVLYNCSNRTMDEWRARGEQKPMQGCLTILLGFSIMILYLVTLIAMVGSNSMNHSCYRQMYFTSIYSIVNIFSSNIVSGYFLVIGATFCTNPNSNFILGTVASGGWIGMSFAVIFLALGRLVEVIGFGKRAFQGKLSRIWMIIPVIGSIFCMFFTHPVIFNSAQGIWTFIPFIIDDIYEEIPKFSNILYFYMVLLTPLAITGIYCILVVYLIILKAKSNKTLFTKMERNMLIQCTIICFFLTLTCYLYLAVFLLKVPEYVSFAAQISYQVTECGPLLAYLIFNVGIRRRVVSTFIRLKSVMSIQEPTRTAEIAPST